MFQRFPAAFPVRFRYAREGYGMNVFLHNASARGVQFSSTRRLFIDDGISLEVRLPDGFAPFVMNGRVVWVRQSGPRLWDAGLAFHRVDLMRMVRLFRLVEPEAAVVG